MKKNLYYRALFKRTNLFKEFILNLFLSIASYPRMVLEVFLRNNFGERYFSLATAVTLSVVLAIIPWIIYTTTWAFRARFPMSSPWSSFYEDYATWYAFLVGFGYAAFLRWREVKRNPSVFDFERFSLYSGNIHPAFFEFKFFGVPSTRLVEILYEPLVCFILGLLLWNVGQPVGMLIMGCSVVYSLSYAGAYYKGDHFVMDKIDEMICNEEMLNSFVDKKDANETRGVRFYGHIPDDKAVRERVVESFSEIDSDVFEVH